MQNSKTRDVLAHGYFGTDPQILWHIIENSLAEVESGLVARLAGPRFAIIAGDKEECWSATLSTNGTSA